MILRPALKLAAIRFREGGEEDDLFALALVGQDGGSVFVVAPERGGAVLRNRERDHLAADLGEALQAALDGEVTFLVLHDDIAGVVPA